MLHWTEWACWTCPCSLCAAASGEPSGGFWKVCPCPYLSVHTEHSCVSAMWPSLYLLAPRWSVLSFLQPLFFSGAQITQINKALFLFSSARPQRSVMSLYPLSMLQQGPAAEEHTLKVLILNSPYQSHTFIQIWCRLIPMNILLCLILKLQLVTLRRERI